MQFYFIYAIRVFYTIKCRKAHTFSLILIITSYLNSRMGFAAQQLNILLSLEDQQCALMDASCTFQLLPFIHHSPSWVNSEQVLLDASLTAWSYENREWDDASSERKTCNSLNTALGLQYCDLSCVAISNRCCLKVPRASIDVMFYYFLC